MASHLPRVIAVAILLSWINSGGSATLLPGSTSLAFDCGPSDATNVYRQELLRRAKVGALQAQLRREVGPTDNPWNHWWLGERLIALSYVAACVDEDNLELRSQARASLLSLLRAAKGGQWWDGRDPAGDDNLNRFVLLACLEAYYFQRHGKHDRPSILPPDAELTLKSAIQIQRNTYGLQQGSNVFRGHYANQDIVYSLILAHSQILSIAGGTFEEASEVLSRVSDAQFSSGGFRYIGVENESPSYHGLVAALVGRYFQVTGDMAALNMVKRSAGYWPSVLSDDVTPEYWSAPWWKQYWARPPIAGLSVARAMSGDARLAYYEARALSGRDIPSESIGYQDVIAAIAWRPLPANSYRPPSYFAAWDDSLRAVRGRYGSMYFGFVAGGGFRNTFVGAMIEENKHSKHATSILGGIFLIDNEAGEKRWLSGSEDEVSWSANGGEAEFCVKYRMNPSTINSWPPPRVTKSPVFASQSWWTEGPNILGALKIRNANDDSPTGRPLTLVARLSGDPIEKISDSQYRAGAFTIEVSGSNVRTSIRRPPMQRGELTQFQELVAVTEGAKVPMTEADFTVTISNSENVEHRTLGYSYPPSATKPSNPFRLRFPGSTSAPFARCRALPENRER